MAGVKGRSGRRRKSIEQHLMAGTYRPDRHGPLPRGGRAAVLRIPAAATPTVGGNALQPAVADPPEPLIAGLGEAGVALVRSVFAEFEMSPAEQAILRTAAESVDRVAEVRDVIARDGVVVTTRLGAQVAHPLLKVEKAAAATFLAAMARLGLPVSEAKR